MVEFALPANSKIGPGTTHPAPSGAGNVKVFKVYRWDPDSGQTPTVDKYTVDLDTCEIIEERWNAWLRWDPVHIVDDHIDALRSLKGLWIECGDVDQYNLVYGARRLHAKLEAAGVEHVYQEFNDNHSSIDYRLDTSLPILFQALT